MYGSVLPVECFYCVSPCQTPKHCSNMLSCTKKTFKTEQIVESVNRCGWWSVKLLSLVCRSIGRGCESTCRIICVFSCEALCSLFLTVHAQPKTPNVFLLFSLVLKTLVDCRPRTQVFTSFWVLEATHMLLNTTKDSRRRTHLFSSSSVFCVLSFISCVNNICSIYWTSPHIGCVLGISSL